MSKADLEETRKQLVACLGYSMTGTINEAIKMAILDESLIKPLFDEYYECSLRHFGVKKLKV